MSATTIPPVYIAPPGIDPQRFGLLSVATSPECPERAFLGVEWEPLVPDRAEVRVHEVCDLDYTPDLLPDGGVDQAEALPFLIAGTYRCPSVGRSLEEAEERARLHLSAGEERAIEYAISTGAMGNAPSFQDADDLTPTAGTPAPLDEGVALLEGHLAGGFHSVPTLHVPATLSVGLSTGRIADRHGQRLETLRGSLVAAGGGYELANVGPDGAAPATGTRWVYGTGRPAIRRGEVFIDQDEAHYLDRDTNDVLIIAQREVLVLWDGPTVAVLVDAPGATA